MVSSKSNVFYGLSNIDFSKSIILTAYEMFASISRAGQSISVYRGDTLVADCTMPSAGLEYLPTVVMAEPTFHDETFSGFVDDEIYTFVAGDDPPTVGFVANDSLYSFDINTIWAIAKSDGMVVSANFSGTRTNYSISQKTVTTKKRYDIKLLPEELLPKTVATKAEVRKAQSTAETAQSKAETAAPKSNPEFTGSFSQNRHPGSTVGSKSHAEGYYTTASGDYSHAEGYYTTASGICSHAQGRCNIEDTFGRYAHIVGNGQNNRDDLSNAHTLDWSGNAWFSGDVYVGSTSGKNKDAGSKKLATEEYVDGKIPAVSANDNGKVLKVVDGAWEAGEADDSTSLGLTGAAVGQIAVISAVDSSGVPTAWTTMDVVSGTLVEQT